MLGPAAALLAFLTDRVLKTLALSAHGEGAFVFKTTLNPGAVFGLPVPTPAIVAISILAMTGVLILAWHNRRPVVITGATFIFLGGLSNVADRLQLGAVIDIFSIGLVTFNISDMMVVLGALLILRYQRRESTP